MRNAQFSIEAAEKVRTSTNLEPDEFSIRLGFSATAYLQSLKRKKLSRWMAERISQRFHVPLEELR